MHYMCIYIYIYILVIHMYIYIYIYMYVSTMTGAALLLQFDDGILGRPRRGTRSSSRQHLQEVICSTPIWTS